MLETLLKAVDDREFGAYLGMLEAGIADGPLGPDALIRLIATLLSRYTAWYENDEEDDGEACFSPPLRWAVGQDFALIYLKKALLDGRFRLEDGVITDGTRQARVEAIRESVAPWLQTSEDARRDSDEIIDWIVSFDRERSAFLLAPLERSPERDRLAAAFLAQGMMYSRLYSRDALKAAQPVWPEALTHAEALEEVARLNHSLYCYDFLESADALERAEEGAAHARMERAQTLSEFVRAATERDFWLRRGLPTFPCTAYDVMSGEQREWRVKRGE